MSHRLPMSKLTVEGLKAEKRPKLVPSSDRGPSESPPVRALASGIFGVAYTLAGIIAVGIILDYLLRLPTWVDGLWRFLGAVPIVCGIALEAAGTYAFWKHGKGTPN